VGATLVCNLQLQTCKMAAMNGVPTSHCANCGTEFPNLSTKTCGNCGRVRAELTTTGFVEASYRVKMKDGQEVGPIPLATVAQMLKDGVIDADTPIIYEGAEKVFFADEHPYLSRFLPGHVKPAPPPSSVPPMPGASSHAYAPPASAYLHSPPRPAPADKPPGPITPLGATAVAIAAIVAFSLLYSVLAVFWPSQSPADRRAKAVQILSVEAIPSSTVAGQSRVCARWKNTGTEPICTIEARLDYLRGGMRVRSEERVILWAGEPALPPGGTAEVERDSNGEPEGAVVELAPGESVQVEPVKAWATDAEFTADTQVR
jgi:hypothetical protein